MEARAPITALPCVITQGGSYYLTSDLTGVEGSHGIAITADNVTIDLNGFSLTGVEGSLRGIFVNGARKNISVRNGTIRHWGTTGVDLGSACNSILSDLRVSNNLGIGIAAGDTSVVTHCASRDNKGDNIQTGPNSAVSDCTAIGSATGHGINLGNSSVVSHCTANYNYLSGIKAFLRCRVHECICFSNAHCGVHISNVGAVQNCLCDTNGFCGILSDAGGLVDIIGNFCSGNGKGTSQGGAGIRVSNASGHRIENNNLALNYVGIDVMSVRNIIFRNTAAANVHGNYCIVVGNSAGPVVNVNGVPNIASIANSGHPTANFEY